MSEVAVGRFARSWQLTKQSWAVLRAEKSLVLFPIISSVALVAITVSFVVPIGVWIAMLAPDAREGLRDSNGARIAFFLCFFAFYVVTYFVMTYFNVALAGAALERFAGRDTSLGAGMRIANRRFIPILQWAVLSATVGMILRALEERAGIFGALALRLVGIAWAVGTYFVVPVLALEGLGPIDSIKRSVSLLKSSWGEAALTRFGTGAVFGLLSLFVFLIGGGVAALFFTQDLPIIGVVAIACTLIVILLLSLVATTLQAILQAAVYAYAAEGTAPAGFSADTLRGVFGPKKPKKA
ncbi:MAG: hypothetical protein JNM94_04060 [Phycisphaerae bacterium]|nr:hypothetical protein [Phycisphaerae bacterium]